MDDFQVTDSIAISYTAFSHKVSRRRSKKRPGVGIMLKIAMVLLLGLLGSSAASATTWTVPGNYATIQLALADAGNVVAGDVISVGPGTFTETGQLVIDRNLTITGAGEANTTIQTDLDTTSTGDARGWFLVNAGITFNLNNVTLDGSGFKIFQAIRSQGNGTIQNVSFTNIFFEAYQGTAIVAFGSPAQNIDVLNCTFTQIGRSGVLYFGSGITDSTFSGNTYTGKGLGDKIDYAVEISSGAIVSVINNTITNSRGETSTDGSDSAAIFISTIFGPGTQATITGNTLSGNTNGMLIGVNNSDTSAVTATNNSITGNTFAGITSKGPIVINATDNWWGHASGPSDAVSSDGSTPDTNTGTGDVARGAINYGDWLHLPPGTVVPVPTMNEWLLIIMSLICLMIGMTKIRKYQPRLVKY